MNLLAELKQDVTRPQRHPVTRQPPPLSKVLSVQRLALGSQWSRMSQMSMAMLKPLPPPGPRGSEQISASLWQANPMSTGNGRLEADGRFSESADSELMAF